MKNKTPPEWMGRPIVDEAHVHELETASAIAEFEHKMPRNVAENKAYEDYTKARRLDAAAHHYASAKAAQGAGHLEEAKKHSAMWEVHCQALGLDPMEPPSAEIMSRLNSPDREKVVKFKAHKGDYFALTDKKPAEGEKIEKAEGRCGWQLGERRCKNYGSKRVNGRVFCHQHEASGHKIAPMKKSVAERLERIHTLAEYVLSKGDVVELPKATETTPTKTKKPGQLVDMRATFQAKRTYDLANSPAPPVGKVTVPGIGTAHNTYDYSYMLPPAMQQAGTTLTIKHKPGHFDDGMLASLHDGEKEISKDFAYPSNPKSMNPHISQALEAHSKWIQYHRAKARSGE